MRVVTPEGTRVVEEIENYTNVPKEEITEIVIPEGVEEIDGLAFDGS